MTMSEPKSTNIARTVPHVSRATREAHLGQRGVTVWFTGLSASGKSTVALLVDQLLTERGHHCCVLDGDNIRRGLNSDLGFSPEDRNENIRRIGEVAKLFATHGTLALTAFISPYRVDRDRNRGIHGPGDFVEVYVECPLEVCEARDPRGLYAKARAGEIPEFTGVSAPYEPPRDAEIVLRTDRETEDESAARVVAYLEAHGYLGPAGDSSRQQTTRREATQKRQLTLA
jgi:adenylylsulfate kinase